MYVRGRKEEHVLVVCVVCAVSPIYESVMTSCIVGYIQKKNISIGRVEMVDRRTQKAFLYCTMGVLTCTFYIQVYIYLVYVVASARVYNQRPFCDRKGRCKKSKEKSIQIYI